MLSRPRWSHESIGPPCELTGLEDPRCGSHGSVEPSRLILWPETRGEALKAFGGEDAGKRGAIDGAPGVVRIIAPLPKGPGRRRPEDVDDVAEPPPVVANSAKHARPEATELVDAGPISLRKGADKGGVRPTTFAHQGRDALEASLPLLPRAVREELRRSG